MLAAAVLRVRPLYHCRRGRGGDGSWRIVKAVHHASRPSQLAHRATFGKVGRRFISIFFFIPSRASKALAHIQGLAPASCRSVFVNGANGVSRTQDEGLDLVYLGFRQPTGKIWHAPLSVRSAQDELLEMLDNGGIRVA